MSALTADLTPLRVSPDYRRLWAGSTVSMVGTQLTTVAVPVQVYRLTHSSLDLGLLGLVAFVPIVTGGLVGGAVADAVDRRRLALVTSTCLAALSVLLTVLAAGGIHRVWPLYAIVGVQAALFSVDSPARSAMLPRLVGARLLPSANALQQIGFNAGFTLGPLLAGVLIATLGLFAAYLVDSVSFLAALYALWRLPAMPPEGGDTARRPSPRAIAEGLRFVTAQRIVLMSFLVDIDAMLFGWFRGLFPAIAAHFFRGGAGTVGLLYSAPAVGALAGAVFSGWFGRVRRQGRAVLVAIAVFAVAVVGFGFARSLWVGLVLLAVSGAADMVSAVYRNTIMQVATPDAMRGRLGGVFIAVVTGGPRLGDLRAGTMASATSLTAAVAGGGMLCLVGLLALAVAVPAFGRYVAPSGAEAAAP